MSAGDMARPLGGLVTGIAAGLMDAAVRKEKERGDSPRSGQPVWRNSYTEGQIEDRLWRPIGVGSARGTRRGAKRLKGAIMQAAKALDSRTRKERKAKSKGVRNGALGHIGLAVLESLYDLVDFATGRLEPAIATIADRVGHSYSAVHNALDRLRKFGFLKWMRRSRPTENKGEAGPQVEQIPNAYVLMIPIEFLDLIKRLVSDGGTPDCERWRREQSRKDLDNLIATTTASRFHHDFWSGDKLTGESFALIAEALDRQERESSKSGETGGSF